MRSNLDNNSARNLRLLSPSHGIIRFDLTGSFTIPSDGPTVHFLDPGALDRTVFLPAITPQSGQIHYVANLSSTKSLNVVDSNGVAVQTVLPNSVTLFISYALGWKALIGLSSVAEVVAAEIAAWTTQTITAATGTIVATDSEVFANRTGVITLTLPDVDLWFAAHSVKTSHLLILGINGAEGTNNVTINRAGSNTINGGDSSGTSLSITTDYGGWKLRRVATGKWGIV